MEAQSFFSPLSHFDATGMLESLALPVLVLDGECCVVFVNSAARALLHLDLRELQGQPLDLLFSEGRRLRSALTALVNLDTETPARALRIPVREIAFPDRQLALKVQVIEHEQTGTHLLVQLARMRPRKAPPVLQFVPVIETARSGPQLECA